MIIDKEYIQDFEYSFNDSEEIIINEGCKSIGYKSLSACDNIKNIKLPESLETIEDRAFYDCEKLEEVYIGSNVNSIGKGVFNGCINLKRIIVSENNPYFISVDDVLYTKNYNTLICFPAGKTTSSYEINKETKIINDSAFSDNPYIENIIINRGVEKICSFAFNNCINLTTVIILDFVNDIESNIYNKCDNIKGFYCLSNCKLSSINSLEKLENLYISGKLEIDFDDDYLKNFGFLKEYKLIDKNIQIIDNDKYTLENYTIFSKDKSILYRVFPSIDVEEYICPDEVKFINRWAFKYCKNIKRIILNEGLETIDVGAFENCEFKEIELPSTVEVIKDFAFTWCNNLKYIKLNDGLKHIGAAVFKECYKLNNVTVPLSVKSVGKRIFQKCDSLNDVKLSHFVFNNSSEIFFESTLENRNITFIDDPVICKVNNTDIKFDCTITDNVIIIPRKIDDNYIKEINIII